MASKSYIPQEPDIPQENDPFLAEDGRAGTKPPPSSAAGYVHDAEQAIRRGFVSKVYGILSAQLAVTFGMVTLFTLNTAVRTYVHHSPALYYSAFALFLVTFFGLVCCPTNAKQYPKNYVFLFLFTVAEGFMLGVNASRFQTSDVMLAMGITIALVVGLTTFACTTKRDFTGAGPYLFVVFFSLMLFGLFALILRSRVLSVVYCSLGVMLFGFYLVYDTQLIVGGDHKIQFGLDDYVFAALNLYLDIINLFLYVLSLVSSGRR